AAGFKVRNTIIWEKQHFVMSRGRYHWQHEPCCFAVKKGEKDDFCGDRSQTTIWKIRNLNPFGISRDDERTSHSTQKPIECMARAIRNHSHGVVVDPFAGSCTTLVAAERLERICYGIELDPGYAAIGIDRLRRLGLEPSLLR